MSKKQNKVAGAKIRAGILSNRKAQQQKVISTELAIDALRRSGYLLETRIAKALEQFASHVSVNAVFVDPETEQSRELDAYCYRAETSDKYEFFSVSAHVLIECVNNPQPIAFFSNGLTTHRSPVSAARPSWLGLYPLEKTIGLEDFHHCFRREHANNYCTFIEKKSGEWMATHADEQHGEFTMLAMLAQLTREKQLQVLEDLSQPQNALHLCGIELIYPLLIAGGSIFDVQQDATGHVHLKSVDHVAYLRRHMWRGVRRYCPIDVVTEKYLPRFLRMIEMECKRTLKRLESRSDEIIEAAKQSKPGLGEPNTPDDPLQDYLP